MDDFLNIVDNLFNGVDVTNSMGDHIMSTHANIQGGVDIFQNGQLVGHTAPNIFDGVDVVDSTGQVINSTHGNIFGGVDIFSPCSSLPVSHTMPNIAGGIDIMDSTGSSIGSINSTPNGFHAKFFK